MPKANSQVLSIPSLDIKADADSVFLSSDQHLNHVNILRYAGRNYDDIRSMNEDIIARHNDKVPSKGSVWICLGDFAFVSCGDCNEDLTLTERLRSFVGRFNGETKILIMGNHDRQRVAQYIAAGFDYVVPKAIDVHCRVTNFNFIMRHRPYSIAEMSQMKQRNAQHGLHSEAELELEGREKFLKFDITSNDECVRDLFPIKGNIMCGHVHQLYRRYAKGNVVNVGLDVWNMTPAALPEALEYFD